MPASQAIRPPAIAVEELEKVFRIPRHQVQTLKERALHPFRRTEYDELKVLDGISFEIGAGEGGTLMLLAMAAAPEATIISVDLPHGAFGGGYPLWKAIYFRQFAIPSQRMHLLRVNSHVPTTVQRVRGILADRMLDVLFIDGDHTYRGVKVDWEMYGPLVAREGLVGFHDIVQHPPETGCEVHTFWRELKARHAHVEIVADHEQAWGGIGVIETGGIGSD